MDNHDCLPILRLLIISMTIKILLLKFFYLLMEPLLSIASHLSASGAGNTAPFPLETRRQFTTNQNKNLIPSFLCSLKTEDKTILFLSIYSVFHWLHFYYAIIIMMLRKNSNKCGVYVISTKKKFGGRRNTLIHPPQI